MKQNSFFLAALLATTLSQAQSIPNGDFEHWATYNYFEPTGWLSSNTETIHGSNWIGVTPVDGHDGVGYGIRMKTDGETGNPMPGYFSNTLGDPLLAQGGTPYHDQPTFLRGFVRYNLLGADTALLVVAFKKAGEVVGFQMLKFYGNQDDFVPFDRLLSLSDTPDSVVFAAVSSDVLHPEVMEMGSFLEIDDLSFDGRFVLPQLPNHDFEEWEHTSLHHAQGWKVTGRTVERTEATPFGEYGIAMTSYSDWQGNVHPSGIRTGYTDPSGTWAGGIPYAQLTDTLRGWYKYLSDGADAGCLSLEMLAGNVSLGGAYYQFHPTEDWTYFEIPMHLNFPPDTLRLHLTSTAFPPDEAVAGSTLMIDNLQLCSQPLLLSTLRIDPPGSPYPNPAVALLHIPLPENYQGDIHLMVYNELGALVKTINVHQPQSIVRLPLDDLAEGNYVYEVQSTQWLYAGKFVKNR